METFAHWAEQIENEHVTAWKAGGGAVVGYSCLFTPPEVLEAAGVLPYRIRALGHANTDLADARLSRFNCRFCRACLQLGLDGTYDFCDGLIETNGCDQLRGMFENWQYARPPAFFHYLKVPHIVSQEAADYFTVELAKYRDAVAAHFGAVIDDAKLWDAIERQTRVRGKLRQLAARREADEPTLSGTEMMQVVLAGSGVPAAVFEKQLDAVLAATPTPRPAGRARLLIGGAATDEVPLLREIEALGGQVVADTFCYGARAFWPTPDTKHDDPLRALAQLYLNEALCPRMYEEFPRRLTFIREAVERAKVNGVILLHNKFCDIHGFDNTLLRMRLEEAGIPTMTLEKEYGAGADLGRLKTRIQAFLERIGGRR